SLTATSLADISFYSLVFIFFKATPPTHIYTLSLHDALPICPGADRPTAIFDATLERGQPSRHLRVHGQQRPHSDRRERALLAMKDRKSTRLNSSHVAISYAVFCLKKKNKRKFS